MYTINMYMSPQCPHPESILTSQARLYGNWTKKILCSPANGGFNSFIETYFIITNTRVINENVAFLLKQLHYNSTLVYVSVSSA